MKKSLVVLGFSRNFAEHLRKMHAQADPLEACEASTNFAKGTNHILRWAIGGKRSGHRETDGMLCKRTSG